MRARRAGAVAVAVLVLAGACGGSGDDEAAEPARRGTTEPSSSSTSSSTSTSTTATPGPTVTPPPAPLPPTVVTAVPSLSPKALVTANGVVVPVLGRSGAGWLVRSPCGRSVTVPPGSQVDGADVVLDAGHGGVEPGAVGPTGLAEAPLNLAVVRHAQAALNRAGLSVLLTRTGDYRITLATRAEIATKVAPRVFVSVHHNAEPDGPRPGPGSETYYQIASPASKRLAGLIYEEVVRALGAYQIPWVSDTDAGAKYRVNDAGTDYYGILRRTAGVTAVLAELAFVSNPPEADLLARPDVQQVEGEALARAIVRYLRTNDPGSGFTIPYPRTSPAGGGGGASNCVDPPL